LKVQTASSSAPAKTIPKPQAAKPIAKPIAKPVVRRPASSSKPITAEKKKATNPLIKQTKTKETTKISIEKAFVFANQNEVEAVAPTVADPSEE
jgi:hypothetical protein